MRWGTRCARTGVPGVDQAGVAASLDCPDALPAATGRGVVSVSLRRVVAGVAAGLVVFAGFGWSPAAAGAGPAPVRRVLVISVPGLTWSEVRDHDLPHIRALLADSGLADLAPRGVLARSTAGGAYLTISAGTRATGDPALDGQQLAAGEPAAGSTAGEVFTRRTGTPAGDGAVALAWPTLVRNNKAQPYDAKLGLLAATLDKAGRGIAAVGNGDGSDSGEPSYQRQVGLAAVGRDGTIADADLGADLSVPAPDRPFGRRLDNAAVARAAADALRAPGGRDRGAVVVEASDLARVMRYRDRVASGRYDDLRAQALADSDDLVGRLVAEVDPARDAVVLVAPYNLDRNRDLTVAAVRAPGWRPGYVRSASTQRAGFLTLVDVGPTVLDLLGVSRPEDMEGRPAEPAPSGHSLDRRIDHLVSENAASRFRENLLFPTTLVVVLGLTAVCAATTVLLVRGGSARARRAVCFAALVDLAILPLSYLARAFPLEDLGAAFYWAFVALGALALAAVATVGAGRLRRPRLALVAVLGAVAAVPLLDVVTGSHLSLSAAFGYSPTGNSRLYGISNYSFGQVAAAACLLAAFVAARWPTRAGRAAAIGMLAGVLVVFGMPTWGSDVGGILAFTPTVLVFGVLVSGTRVRWRTVLIAVVVTGLAIFGFGMADLARPPSQRAHLGRLFERVGKEGPGPLFDIIDRKLMANLRVTTSSFWVAAIPVAVIFLVFLYRSRRRPLDPIRAALPTLGAGVGAALVAAVLGSAVNDSGAIVGGVALTVVAAALGWLALGSLTVPARGAPPGGGPPGAAGAPGAPAPEPSPEERPAAPVRVGADPG
jgi:hypothetical protein